MWNTCTHVLVSILGTCGFIPLSHGHSLAFSLPVTGLGISTLRNLNDIRPGYSVPIGLSIFMLGISQGPSSQAELNVGYAPRELTRCVLAAFEVTLASICCCCPFYGRTGAFAGPLGCPIWRRCTCTVLYLLLAILL